MGAGRGPSVVAPGGGGIPPYSGGECTNAYGAGGLAGFGSNRQPGGAVCAECGVRSDIWPEVAANKQAIDTLCQTRSKVVVPTPLGLFAMYTGCCAKGTYPVFIPPTEVTVGEFVAVVVYE